MPIWLNTRGRSTLAIAICQRCRRKRPYSELVRDGNVSGLWVCAGVQNGCWDPIDPRKLKQRDTENISLDRARPDASLAPALPVPPDYGQPVIDDDLF